MKIFPISEGDYFFEKYFEFCFAERCEVLAVFFQDFPIFFVGEKDDASFFVEEQLLAQNLLDGGEVGSFVFVGRDYYADKNGDAGSQGGLKYAFAYDLPRPRLCDSEEGDDHYRGKKYRFEVGNFSVVDDEICACASQDVVGLRVVEEPKRDAAECAAQNCGDDSQETFEQGLLVAGADEQDDGQERPVWLVDFQQVRDDDADGYGKRDLDAQAIICFHLADTRIFRWVILPIAPDSPKFLLALDLAIESIFF